MFPSLCEVLVRFEEGRLWYDLRATHQGCGLEQLNTILMDTLFFPKNKLQTSILINTLPNTE